MVLRFGPRVHRPAKPAPWTRDAAWIPDDEAEAEIRYRDPTQMGKVYLVPGGIDRPVPGDDAIARPGR